MVYMRPMARPEVEVSDERMRVGGRLFLKAEAAEAVVYAPRGVAVTVVLPAYVPVTGLPDIGTRRVLIVDRWTLLDVDEEDACG